VIAVIGRSRVIETASLTADWRGWSRIRKRPNLHHGDTETRRKTGKRFTTDQHWWQWSGKDQVIAVIARDRGWEKDRNSPRRRGEQPGRGLPLIDTDDADQEKIGNRAW